MQGWDVLFGYLDSGIRLGYLIAINCFKLTVDYFRTFFFCFRDRDERTS